MHQYAKGEFPKYTCHAWLVDGKFAVCSDLGEILIMEQNGEFKGWSAGDIRTAFPILAMETFVMGASNAAGANNAGKSGFIVAGQGGLIRVFHKSETDPKKPYLKVEGDDLYPAIEHYPKEANLVYRDIDMQKINSIVLSPKCDTIVFTTKLNQIIKVPINLDRPNEEQRYEHLVASFHSKPISGLDVCIKKQLVATCSGDRTVRLWSYTAGNTF